MRKTTATVIMILAMAVGLNASNPIKKRSGREHYVKTTMEQMSLEQMVGQLIMTASDATDNPAYIKKIIAEIDSNKVGGVCFFKGTSDNIPMLIDKYNSVCSIPLLTSIDGEWGLGMRCTDLKSFQRAMSLGALTEENYDLVYRMAKVIAGQCRRLGIHINFAPSVDINLNAANPVINTRSFGEDKHRVALLAEQYVRGLQDEGIMAVVKHFPGHGDTETDSHVSLPTINHTKAFIDSVDAYPFIYNMERGVWGAMVAHLNVPALNKDCKYPSSINPDIINGYLIEELDFKGLVFTDAMNMKGLTNDFKDGRAQVLALKAGVDILLMPENTYEAHKAIMQAVKEGELTEDFIREKCAKVLRWKYDLGVITSKDKPQPLTREQKDEIETLSEEIAEKTLTLLKNEDCTLPLDSKDSSDIVFIGLGQTSLETMAKEISERYGIRALDMTDSKNDTVENPFAFIDSTKTVICALSGGVNTTRKNNYGINRRTLDLLSRIDSANARTVLVLMANPYVLESLDTVIKPKATLVAYQNTDKTRQAVLNSIFSIRGYEGLLPVSVSNIYREGCGITERQVPCAYREAEQAGLDIACFQKIDSLIDNAIKQKACPGAQILVMKDGKKVFERNAGYYTYDKEKAVTSQSIYDVASLTKVTATTLALMKLYEEDRFDLDDKLSEYLPYLKKTNKSKITIKEALSHIARLKAFLPLWQQSLKDAKTNEKLYAFCKSDDTNYIQVADSLYILKSYREKTREQIALSEQTNKHTYLYSDLGFIMLGDLVETLSGKPLDQYIQETFYEPMGLKNTSFNPIAHGIDSDRIVPTIEKGDDFRHIRLKGFVHDETAAINGGVAGHAGLFSNAEDLAALCSMLLNGGEYDGKQYLKNHTIKVFNKRYYEKYDNRRGLGFDKPLIEGRSVHTSRYASDDSFGHSGFTGTYLWVDPKEDLIYIFLSNRVYPDAKSNKLSQMNIRTDIQDLIYESIGDDER